ncbi:leucyl aminopeptidase family protein [Nisaea acidiphila]|uniref:Leucyl aminopeptidase family protein n=1 Tax=Nisaea acidiphila TaxID=1862145 RepID=A0A9J7AML4_9PROT|nr:leucyl aminopeptidase family protein [Nisaea acidiphila]UUX48194.1 leucyl aminopeptidase family protein [Nisaea acidiphila]
MPFRFVAKATPKSIPLTPVTAGSLAGWLKTAEARTARWVRDSGFKADAGTVCLVPDADGGLERVLFGAGESAQPGGGLWDLAPLPPLLPKGRYYLDADLAPEAATRAATGWALAHYRFDKFKEKTVFKAELVWPEGADQAEVTRLAEATGLARDLINRPANDLGPAELAEAAAELAKRYKAKVAVTEGEALLAENYPMVHAVGRAADRAPRLIDIRWGKKNHPKVTIVGKGVIFDSGGLDLKPASAMLMMKKDMGGSAQALALAQLVMDAKLPVRLRVLVPAVENAVSGNAFRPMDILSSRKGLTVEVGNTDAEGRLVLADALTEADSEAPEMILDFSTLTGAARVALGTEVPALFANDDALAADLLEAGEEVEDHLWRLPLHQPYKAMLKSPNADLSSTGSGGYAGAITAALFLEHFVSPKTRWAHVDLMAWNLKARPGRPEGGEAMGVRAFYKMLRKRYG